MPRTKRITDPKIKYTDAGLKECQYIENVKEIMNYMKRQSKGAKLIIQFGPFENREIADSRLEFIGGKLYFLEIRNHVIGSSSIPHLVKDYPKKWDLRIVS